MIIPLESTEIKLRDAIISEELRCEMRNEIIRIFSQYDAEKDAIDMQRLFPTMPEVQATYHHVSILHLKMWKLMLKAAGDSVHLACLMRSCNKAQVA
jgi:hypothetical protein